MSKDIDIVICGFCKLHYLPVVNYVLSPTHTSYNYKCPGCGANDYNKIIYRDKTNKILQPSVSRKGKQHDR